jgi:hypothetical protein
MRPDCWTRGTRIGWSAIRSFLAEPECRRRSVGAPLAWQMPTIAVYAKNQKENLNDAEKQALAKTLQPIKQQEH